MLPNEKSIILMTGIYCFSLVREKGRHMVFKKRPIFIVLFFFGNALVFGESFFELCKSGSPGEIKKAIDMGAEVNITDDDGWTPLMRAAGSNENPEVIKVLLDAGAYRCRRQGG